MLPLHLYANYVMIAVTIESRMNLGHLSTRFHQI